jgi:hypothetical protein|tara:strand:- start:4552 stop:4959 length:408 start_codon:yes stop_codon:yes gene_type:complete
MLRETDVAYLAGLFDGEGSVQYKQYMRKRSHGKKAYPTWSIRLELAMTEKSTVKWIHDFTGCGSFGERKVQPGRKRQWRWRCSHRDAFYVACLMWPYSHTKLSMLNKILQHYDFWKEKNVINMEDWKYANMERKV